MLCSSMVFWVFFSFLRLVCFKIGPVSCVTMSSNIDEGLKGRDEIHIKSIESTKREIISLTLKGSPNKFTN